MMKHFKINVGRKKLPSEYIQSKQNFDLVLGGVKPSKPSFWKSVWFYGTIGMAGATSIVGYKFYKSEKQLNETLITQETTLKKEINNYDFIPVRSIAYDEAPLVVVDETQMSSQKKKMMEKKGRDVSVDGKKDVELINNIESNSEMQEVIIAKSEDSFNASPIIQKKQAKSNMPSVSGVYNGDISWESFKEGVVFVNEDISVKQFSIQYSTRLGDKIASVKGDRIPSEVVSELEALGLDQTIFITNVVAGDREGSSIRFVSMDLNLKFK
jgi:hypothetical protein